MFALEEMETVGTVASLAECSPVAVIVLLLISTPVSAIDEKLKYEKLYASDLAEVSRRNSPLFLTILFRTRLLDEEASTEIFPSASRVESSM